MTCCLSHAIAGWGTSPCAGMNPAVLCVTFNRDRNPAASTRFYPQPDPAGPRQDGSGVGVELEGVGVDECAIGFGGDALCPGMEELC